MSEDSKQIEIDAAIAYLTANGVPHEIAYAAATSDHTAEQAAIRNRTINQYLTIEFLAGAFDPPDVPEGVILQPLENNVQPLRYDINTDPPEDSPEDFQRRMQIFEMTTGAISPEFDSEELAQKILWRSPPVFKDGVMVKAGKMEPNSLHNILVYLRHKSDYRGMFRYDQFSGKIMLPKAPFFHIGGREFKPREIINTDSGYMTERMECEGVSSMEAKVITAIEMVAQENGYNPVLEHLDSLVWDKEPRLHSWLKKVMGATGDDNYLSAIGIAWWVGLVARVYQPGCKNESCLVFEGKQGKLKSTALRVIARLGLDLPDDPYFCDTVSFAQIAEKDTVLKLRGKILVEFSDLSGLTSRDVEDVKAFLSTNYDEIRKPYGRQTERFYRTYGFAGSTNKDVWLVDETGNRRFLPVSTDLIDIDLLNRIVGQLWAEAVAMYKSGAAWWVGRDSVAWQAAEIEQAKRMPTDVWHEPVSRFVEWMSFVTIGEVLTHLKIDVKDQKNTHQKQVTSILKQLGFVRKQKRVEGKPVSGWERTTETNEITEAEITMEF